MKHQTIIYSILLFVFLLLGLGNSKAEIPVIPEKLFFSTSLRTRYELVDWFEPKDQSIDNSYDLYHTKLQSSLRYKSDKLTAAVMGQYFQVYDVPVDGNGPGALYYVNNYNSSSPGDFSIRQGYVRYSDKVGDNAFAGTAGRFFYANGDDVVTNDKLLESIKQDRIYNRVLGTFDFQGGRSFDGARTSFAPGNLGTLSAAAMHPTQGGFATNAMPEIDQIDLVTAALTSNVESWLGRGEFQLFYYYYDDGRDGVVKLDNRQLDVRAADQQSISLHNIGVHSIQIYETETITFDHLLWGITQFGNWGDQSVLAGTFAAEFGATASKLAMTPSVRIGFNWGSGDSNAADGDHNTFFQMLPTVRQYAMTPFFNLMNNEDLFLQVAAKPLEKMKISSALHYLSLQSGNDLLYAGAGANRDKGQFGFNGVALADEEIGTFFDITVAYEVCSYLTTSIYYGHLFGASGPDDTFTDGDIDYGFIEATFKL